MPLAQRPSGACRPVALILCGLLVASAGCLPLPLDGNGGSLLDSFVLLGAPIGGDTPGYAEVEPNNDFASANGAALDEVGQAVIRGSLATGQDVDVFEIGPADAGTRFVVTVDPGGWQAIAVGMFEADGNLLYLALHAGINGTPQYFEVACRAPATKVYVTVASPPGQSVTGDYSLEIRRRAGAMPLPAPQLLVLDFDGDPAVSIGGGTPVNVPVFDAGRIGAAFAGQTETIRQKVLDGVRAAFEGLDVTVLASDDPGAYDGARSTVYFGTYNPDLLGLADSVDAYNGDTTQSAIIFTDTFSLFTVLNPTVDQISQALANVAAHEAGHLLGLWHTRDPRDLMDITATARQMLRPQNFLHAPLHATVAPLGSQDGFRLLAWAVGGNLKNSTRNQRSMPVVEEETGGYDFEIDRRLLSVGTMHCVSSD